MPKPSQLPRWATGAGAKVTPEPTEGKKDLGWVSAEKPPESYWNWLLNRIYLWCVYLDGLTNEALTWAGKAIFNAGLATPIAPVAGDDVANKTYVDGKFPLDATRHGAQTSGTLHAAATAAVNGFMPSADKAKLDAATSAPTASRLAIRDAAGRAQFADPAAAQDAATKGYVDGRFPAVAWTALPLSPNWTNGAGNGALMFWKDPVGVVHIRGYVTAAAGAASPVCPAGALPVGSRPGANPGGSRSFAMFKINGAAVSFAGYASVGSDGSLLLPLTTIAAGDIFSFDVVSFVAET